MKAVLLGSRNGGLERVEALNARARSAGLVEFVLVDATQEPHHIVQELSLIHISEPTRPY